ncbi:MAG: hypothetical protein HY520_00735 [Candidatus Aenigmarchaeota archaeon]|nr:hypothetical protein [Candidatus Aenigmarchaeota archaeon]
MKTPQMAIMFIGMIMLLGLAIVVILRLLGPYQFAEYQGAELAHIIASELTALSAEEQVYGTIRLEREQTFDISVIYYDPLLFPAEHARRLYRWVVGAPPFGQEGYYVVVTPYKGEGQVDSSVAPIAGFLEDDEAREQFIEKVSTVCVSKAKDQRFAEVAAC